MSLQNHSDNSNIWALSFSLSSNYLASGGNDSKIIIYKTSDWTNTGKDI